MSRIRTNRSSLSAINPVATPRAGRGAFQSDIVQANANSLSVALENVSASESNICDADFAAEAAALTPSQIRVQATAAPQSVPKLPP